MSKCVQVEENATVDAANVILVNFPGNTVKNVPRVQGTDARNFDPVWNVL